MLIEFIAAFAAAAVGAGIAMLVRMVTKGALPRVMVPIFAAVGMFGFTIWGEYSWFSRTADALPEGVVVVQTYAEPSSFRPWTHLTPFVSRFMAVDQTAIRANADVPGQRLVELLLFTHRAPATKLPMLIDCAAGRRADIADGMVFDAAGNVTNADWTDVPAGDPLLQATCS
ncbi:MAG: hypothetical protein AAF409_03235 [Pseudomonadota bacterium]